MNRLPKNLGIKDDDKDCNKDLVYARYLIAESYQNRLFFKACVRISMRIKVHAGRYSVKIERKYFERSDHPALWQQRPLVASVRKFEPVSEMKSGSVD